MEQEVAALTAAARADDPTGEAGSSSASTRAAASALVASLLGISLPLIEATADAAPPSDMLPITPASQRGAGAGAGAAGAAVSPPPQQQQQQGVVEAAGPAPADGDSMAVDDDDGQDMFACEFAVAQHPPQETSEAGAAAADGVGPSSGMGEDGGATPMEVAGLQEVGGGGLAPESQDEEGGDGEEALQGFVLDPDSGLYYNSTLGFYFDPASQRWRDAGSGIWYRMEDGQYIAD